MSTAYPSYRERRRNEEDSFHKVYVPLLKISLQISTVKYICLLVYSIRSMQEHLSLPTYCKDATRTELCSSSSCYWLLKLVQNLPRFMLSEWFFVEQCAYLLIFFFISCSLFLYSVYLIRKEGDLKIRYRAVLTLPSMFFELIICFLSYYATITSIFEYSRTASMNPNFFSSAFIIFAFIISIFYAILIVIHFASLYYIMIYPVVPLSHYAMSNTNYSTLNYGQFFGGGGSRRSHYETLPSVANGAAPQMMNESFRLSSVSNWQNANETRSNRGGCNGGGGTISSYSQIRGWNNNNTIRSTNTHRSAREVLPRDDDHDYLELI
ncbi:hypothetical protein CAEBREN_24549 [Caenorhabditis brenneri]|uniref:Uncharacterized protein n=1 Tax=Caenorhabditis brenneri TaxID=135651 RepID=G0MM71_CAEBE|nr:hypothetical protein CAEBREN_24549 [Caenorhabditis brenneri]